MARLKELESAAIEAFKAEAKIGLLATVDPAGLPHISMISSVRARDPEHLMWGQFTEGRSKTNVRQNPKTGWLVLTMDKRLWRGKALWTGAVKDGPDYIEYNNTPMFRYNSYFGINTVHYMDLVETGGEEKLPMPAIVIASILSKMAGGHENGDQILIPWAQGLFSSLSTLTFISWIGKDGFPIVVPIIQAHAPDSRSIAFSGLAYGRELATLFKGTTAAVFGLSLKMEDVLVRGIFQGFSRSRGAKIGRLDIDWVYNSMPPKQGQVYPRPELKPVTEF